MTCVQQPHQAFPPDSFNPSGFPITAGKNQDDWRIIAKGDAATEDIRFSFSIWHVPTSISEPVQRKSDTATRGRTPSRLVGQARPFAWLPLLPLEEPAELPVVCNAVETGISLSLPPVDEGQHVSTTTLIRRVPSVDVGVDDDTLPAKKKQRLSFQAREVEGADVIANNERAERAIPVERGKISSGTLIRRVRMRDVHILEDFLVSDSDLHKAMRRNSHYSAGSILARVWDRCSASGPSWSFWRCCTSRTRQLATGGFRSGKS